MTRTEALTKIAAATPAQLDALYVALIGYPPIAECGEDPESVRDILTDVAIDQPVEVIDAFETTRKAADDAIAAYIAVRDANPYHVARRNVNNYRATPES